MVCIACLLPLFLVPIVNLLPLLFYYIMGKVYALFGWEYRKPERAPPACPIKPRASQNVTGPTSKLNGQVEPESGRQVPPAKPVAVQDKQE